MEVKKKIIYFLVVFSVILLIANALLDKANKRIIQPFRNDGHITRQQLENHFVHTLRTFGIQGNWIKKKPLKSKYDSLKYKYEIEVPSEVPIPLILKELPLDLNYKDLNISSEENETNGSTKLMIKSGNYVKLMADLKYNYKLHRPYSYAAFILQNAEDLNIDELNRLLQSPYKFGVLLPLRISSVPIAEKILKNGKNYFINLDDDAEKLTFQLDEDLGVKDLKRNIKSIVSSFNTPKYYFISKKRTGFSKSFINFLTDEFAKKNRKVLEINSFVKIKGEDLRDLKSLLSFHLNNIPKGKSKLFFVDVENWEAIQSVINYYVRKGNKITLPNNALK